MALPMLLTLACNMPAMTDDGSDFDPSAQALAIGGIRTEESDVCAEDGGCTCTNPVVHVSQWGYCDDDTPWSHVPVETDSVLVGWLESAGNTVSDAPSVEVDALAVFVVRDGAVVASLGTDEANELGGAQYLAREDHAFAGEYDLPPRTADTASFSTTDPDLELHPFGGEMSLTTYEPGDVLVSVARIEDQDADTCTRAGVDEHRASGTGCSGGICERGHGPWLCGEAGYLVSANLSMLGCEDVVFEGTVDGETVEVDVCARTATLAGSSVEPLPAPPGFAVRYSCATERNELSWSTVPGAEGYQVYWGTDPAVTSESEAMPITTSTSYTHDGLAAGGRYSYRVAAIDDAGGEGLLSPVRTDGPPPATSAPVWRRARWVPPERFILLQWRRTPGATTYRLFWGTETGVTTDSEELSTAATEYAHSGMVSGASYFYRVAGVNRCGEMGSLSDEVEVRVP
ncbi:hypothetical protein L6R53_00830 [Myxococcota bacterium]|nr:hypothetical protein [Myxococcota bacterium]